VNRLLPKLYQVFLLTAALFIIQATEGQNFQADWQKARDRQPPGLRLELKLPKTEYHQGEIIPATLVFRNSSTNQYHLWIGTYDRSGRIPDIAFRAERQDHVKVADPLGWYLASYCGIGGGLGNEQDLGEWSITLPVNQWLRLDAPGLYRVYAWSNRAKPGANDINSSPKTNFDLVSDVVTVKIVSLEPKQEQTVLADAQVAFAKGGESTAHALQTLRYLQTPAARQMLVPLLSKEQSFEAMMGLVGAPDPVAESHTVLEAAKRPDIAVTENTLWLYTVLRSFGQKFSDLPDRHWKELEEANKTFRREFINEVRSAVSAKQGEILLSTVLTLLVDSPEDRTLRAVLVDHKKQLTKRQIEQLVQCWNKLAGDDLLPVLRMAAKPPLSNTDALGLLARISPADARPLIVEDLLREHSQYINPAEGRYALDPLMALPDRELPELDETLRRKLLAKDSDLFTVMPLIARYATTNLLTDVLMVYRRAEGRWACDIQDAALRYLVRCQPQEGIASLARVLKARIMTGCYHGTLSGVLMENWHDAALPVVVEALQDDDPEVVESAVKVLERHAGTEVIPQVIDALDRLSATTSDGIDQAWRAQTLASMLRRSDRWCLTAEQKQQLADAVQIKPASSHKRISRSDSSAATYAKTRSAFPPTNWTLRVSASIRPYEEFWIRIAGASLDDDSFKVSSLTKIDEKEIGRAASDLQVQGYSDSSGAYGLQLANTYPLFQFPAAWGEHSIDLVLSTTMTDYHFQRCIVRVEASEEERKQVAEFEASGASRFLRDSDESTPRQSESPASVHKPAPIPYAEVIRFVERHRQCYLTSLIASRIVFFSVFDSSLASPLKERLWLGKILGAIDKEKYSAMFRQQVGDKQSANTSKLWLDAVESYRPQ